LLTYALLAIFARDSLVVLDYTRVKCKRATVLKRRDGDVLALACRGVSVALSARYKSGLEVRREQHELILLHPYPTVPSYAAINPLTLVDARQD
jgi:hypothetical protein